MHSTSARTTVDPGFSNLSPSIYLCMLLSSFQYSNHVQLAAAAFDLPGSRVEVRMNDSELPAYGIGTFASRTLQTAGSAVWLAAQAARE